MEDDSATVALRAEEAFEVVLDAELGLQQRFGQLADGPGTQLELQLPGLAALDDFRFVAEA